MERFPYYSHVPTLNPYCCRISIQDYSGVMAFEDFCAAGNTFQKYLDNCERKFDFVECGELAEATHYYYDSQSKRHMPAHIYKGMKKEKPEYAESYYFKVSAVDDKTEIKVFNSKDC